MPQQPAQPGIIPVAILSGLYALVFAAPRQAIGRGGKGHVGVCIGIFGLPDGRGPVYAGSFPKRTYSLRRGETARGAGRTMTTVHTGQISLTTTPEKLVSWKSIAKYFECDERTAKRWERERALPVHRAPGGKRSGVFAYVSELDSWLNNGMRTGPPTNRRGEDGPGLINPVLPPPAGLAGTIAMAGRRRPSRPVQAGNGSFTSR